MSDVKEFVYDQLYVHVIDMEHSNHICVDRYWIKITSTDTNETVRYVALYTIANEVILIHSVDSLLLKLTLWLRRLNATNVCLVIYLNQIYILFNRSVQG